MPRRKSYVCFSFVLFRRTFLAKLEDKLRENKLKFEYLTFSQKNILELYKGSVYLYRYAVQYKPLIFVEYFGRLYLATKINGDDITFIFLLRDKDNIKQGFVPDIRFSLWLKLMSEIIYKQKTMFTPQYALGGFLTLNPAGAEQFYYQNSKLFFKVQNKVKVDKPVYVDEDIDVSKLKIVRQLKPSEEPLWQDFLE